MRFTLTTRGIEAGYDKDGFFVFGRSTIHGFDAGDWSFVRPPITGMAVDWHIDMKGEDAFERYKEWIYPPSEISPRVQAIADHLERIEERPCGHFRRWSPEDPIALRYSLPSDPTLVAFIMGVVAADRELVISGNGFYLIEEDDEPKAAPSSVGFMERKEPVFLTDRPTFRVK